MNMTTRIGGATLAATLLLALPIVGSAYEVAFLDGRGAETKALNDGEYDAAIRRLEKKLGQRRHHRGVLLTNLCTALVVTRDLEKAHSVCNEAVEFGGQFAGNAYNSRGVLHALMNDPISARADFAEATRKTNYPPASLSTGPERILGALGRSAGNLDKALLMAEDNRQSAEEYFDKMTAGPGYRPEDEDEK